MSDNTGDIQQETQTVEVIPQEAAPVEGVGDLTKEVADVNIEESGSGEESVEFDFFNSSDDVVAEEDTILYEDEFIKQKTGGKYASLEQVLQDANKNASLEFKNEVSEKAFKMIEEGKLDELTEILYNRKVANDVKGKDDETVLKAFIKMNNPEFDLDDIDQKYDSLYIIDEDEPKWAFKELKQKISVDVKNAREHFIKLAESIEFPIIEKDNVPAILEEEIQKQKYVIDDYHKQLSEIDKTVNGLKLKWEDKKAGIVIDSEFKFQPSDFNHYKEALKVPMDFLQARYTNQDGTVNAAKMARDFLFLDNIEKVVPSLISQAVNGTRVQILKNSRGITQEQAGRKSPQQQEPDNHSAYLKRMKNR